jgi:hypothetical protein
VNWNWYYHPAVDEASWEEILADETLKFDPKPARDPRENKRREWRQGKSKFTHKEKRNDE